MQTMSGSRSSGTELDHIWECLGRKEIHLEKAAKESGLNKKMELISGTMVGAGKKIVRISRLNQPHVWLGKRSCSCWDDTTRKQLFTLMEINCLYKRGFPFTHHLHDLRQMLMWRLILIMSFCFISIFTLTDALFSLPFDYLLKGEQWHENTCIFPPCTSQPDRFNLTSQ